MSPKTPDWAPLLSRLSVAGPDAQAPLIRLRTLAATDTEALWAVAQDPALWSYSLTRVASRADFEGYLATALDEQARGLACPLVIADASGQVAGSTRLGNLAPAHRRLEIGWTWIGRPWQRTGLNRAVKTVLLDYCFGVLGCERVEFKANALNAPSRRALEGLGASYEGCLRRHMVSDTGVWRDTVYYSILAEEWPTLRVRLVAPR